MGDWLGSDQTLLQSLKTSWLIIGDLLVFLAMCLAAWFNINQLSYNPHDGLLLTTHYQVAINAFQNTYLAMAILVIITLVKLLSSRSLSSFYAILGGLMLNLLAIPKLFVPFLKYQPRWHLSIAIAAGWAVSCSLAVFAQSVDDPL